jgi:hypothetical protein
MNRRAWLLVLACAALLAARKPWALHTPQLWAEDGSIFLVQDEQMGVHAWIEPYNGYLHLLPRLIAWTARQAADPAWWPAIYNGLAFALSVALFARLASRRVALPAKAGLVLALALVVGSGEVLINVTNLQWLTAFFLIGQLFLQPPAGIAARLTDLAVLGIVGLNGPFALLLLPAFAWRAWRGRNPDTTLALAVVGVCAGTQAWFLAHTGGLTLHEVTGPFQPVGLLATTGSRLVIWPLLGPAGVRGLPTWLHAAAAGLVISWLVARALRAHREHPERTVVALLFCLVAAASAYRARIDTWNHTDMANGDRYFYLPRVLLTWLLIWECQAPARTIAWIARAACAVGLAAHAPHFILPAPPDYQWRAHCDPIRHGAPANIHTLPEGWWIEYPGRPRTP